MKNLGGVINIVLPLVTVIGIVLFAESELITDAEAPLEISVLRYGLVIFSVTICVAARIILRRMISAVRSFVRAGSYRTGRIFYCYLAVYALYLVPSVWGFAYFMLTGGVLALLIMASVTILAYLFLTPNLESFWQSGNGG